MCRKLLRHNIWPGELAEVPGPGLSHSNADELSTIAVAVSLPDPGRVNWGDDAHQVFGQEHHTLATVLRGTDFDLILTRALHLA
jgi:hypothetical protein